MSMDFFATREGIELTMIGILVTIFAIGGLWLSAYINRRRVIAARIKAFEEHIGTHNDVIIEFKRIGMPDWALNASNWLVKTASTNLRSAKGRLKTIKEFAAPKPDMAEERLASAEAMFPNIRAMLGTDDGSLRAVVAEGFGLVQRSEKGLYDILSRIGTHVETSIGRKTGEVFLTELSAIVSAMKQEINQETRGNQPLLVLEGMLSHAAELEAITLREGRALKWTNGLLSRYHSSVLFHAKLIHNIRDYTEKVVSVRESTRTMPTYGRGDGAVEEFKALTSTKTWGYIGTGEEIASYILNGLPIEDMCERIAKLRLDLQAAAEVIGRMLDPYDTVDSALVEFDECEVTSPDDSCVESEGGESSPASSAEGAGSEDFDEQDAPALIMLDNQGRDMVPENDDDDDNDDDVIFVEEEPDESPLLSSFPPPAAVAS